MIKLKALGIVPVLAVLLFVPLQAQNQTPVEIDPLKIDKPSRGSTVRDKAMEYLTVRNEVVLKVTLPFPEMIGKIAQMASIDKVVNSDVIVVYMNMKQFKKFEGLNCDYEVLVPESMQIPKKRGGNYRNFNIRDNINTFPTYQGYLNIMKGFAAAAPEICKIKDVGQSYEGRNIEYAIISDNVNEEEAEPKVNYTSTIHGDETVGFIIYLKLIQYLITNYDTDNDVKNLVDNAEIWINPLHNPDGTYSASNGQSQYGATRTNANGVDMNRSFPDVTQPNGKNASSAPAMVAVRDNDIKQRFYIGADSHTGMEALVMPWSYQKGIPAPSNKKVWQYLGKVLKSDFQQIFVCETGPYAADGTRFDFGYYKTSSVFICPELSSTKPIQEGQFDYMWNKFSDGFIALLEEALNGIHGLILDKDNNEPIEATITVSDLDDDGYGMVETHKFGNFYHTATTGTYDITIEPSDTKKYDDTTLTNVSVTSGEQTFLEIRLKNKLEPVTQNSNPLSLEKSIKIRRIESGIEITLNGLVNVKEAKLFGLNGKIAKNISFKASGNVLKAHINNDLSNGIYYLNVRSDTKEFSKKIIMF